MEGRDFTSSTCNRIKFIGARYYDDLQQSFGTPRDDMVHAGHGCLGYVILKAFDDAISYGVDTLSVSITSEPGETVFTDNPIAIGAFNVVEKASLCDLDLCKSLFRSSVCLLFILLGFEFLPVEDAAEIYSPRVLVLKTRNGSLQLLLCTLCCTGIYFMSVAFNALSFQHVTVGLPDRLHSAGGNTLLMITLLITRLIQE
ncbi:hypothetical protein RD792_012281 [Penstemon davidsonii]|uniref:Uncharacterized protein n=1 Tax=Penstemon davidsonii TaxID=160366 RepID=A0ABR0CXV4_9LAMI|nr:hypothetical protein RD792_012281 [Penstemon davidsonii]